MVPANIKVICISIDAIGMLICLLLKYDFGSDTLEIKDYDKKIFNHLLWSTFAIILVDALTWGVLNIPKYSFQNFILTAIYYPLHFVVATFWVMYCDYKIYEDEQRVKIIKYIFSIPTVIAIVASIISYKYPILFTITEDNVYYRGKYYNIFVVIVSLYVIYSIYIVLNRMYQDMKNNIFNKKLFILMLYPTIPVLGAIVQSAYYGVNVVWLLITTSLIIIYFNFQNSLLIIDPITKINNRYKFDVFLDKHFDKLVVGQYKFFIIIDIDKFKSINDRFGHLEGDNALRIIAKILTEKASVNDLVARLGGDEFAIFGIRNSEIEIENLIKNINEEVIKFNNSSDVGYQISLSIGYSIQDKYNSKTRDQMITEADKNMYQEKLYCEL